MTAVLRTGFAEVEGGRLFYTIQGEGEPVVLVHGFSLDHRMWDDQVPALVDRYQVIRYDLRGFGRSSRLSEQPYRHIDDLRALLDQLGLAQCHIVGLSLGGMLMTEFTLAYPERVRSLTLIDSALNGFRLSEAVGAQIRLVHAAAHNGDLDGARRLWLEHPLFAWAQRRPAVAARLAMIVADYTGDHWLGRDRSLNLDPPAAARLAAIRVPVLVLVGAHDMPDFLRIAEVLAAGIPGARRVVIPDAGHMANMERPDVVNAELRAFLDSVSAGR